VNVTRATLAMMAGALASVVLFATPSFAASTPAAAATSVSVPSATDDPPYDQMDESELQVAVAQKIALPYAGRRVKQQGSSLLDSGTVEEMRAWLETGYRLAQAEDDNVAIAHTLTLAYAGTRVKQEAGSLLDSSTPEERRAWLETGYRLAQADDDRVALARILATPGISDATRQTISDLLDEDSPEAMRTYLAANGH
jgi:hypothetical protein